MTAVREIDVRKQAQLSFARVFRLVLAGISHRFFRSFLTMAVILLAVAFFMAMLSESVFIRATARGVAAEIAETRDASRRLGLYFKPPATTLLLAQTLARADRDGTLPEYIAVSGEDPENLRRLVADAQRERVYLDFMTGLKSGQRLILFQKRRDRDAFARLLSPAAWNDFLAALRSVRAVRLPAPDPGRPLPAAPDPLPPGRHAAADHELGDLPNQPATRAFRQFLDEYPAYLDRLAAFDRRWRAAVGRFAEASRALAGVDDLGIGAWLAHADGGDAERWRTLVAETGFALDAAAFAGMRAYLKTADLRNRLRRELATRPMRARWDRAYPDRKLTMEQKLALLDRPGAVNLTVPYPAEELAEASRFFADADRMRPFHALLARQPARKNDDGTETPPREALALELQKVDARFVDPAALDAAALDPWLLEASPETAQAFGEMAPGAFRQLSAGEQRELRHIMQLLERTARLRVDLTSDQDVLAQWAARPEPRGGDAPADKFAYLARPEAGALWPRSAPEELAAVARLSVRESRLNALEEYLSRKIDGPLDDERGVLTGKQLFLLLISFCVCMVGIANAMLMAITERFREIATMKCLGATDGFILTQFMMEAGLQGMIGGVLGMAAGLALALAKNSWVFGLYLWRYFPAFDLFASSLVCIGAGVLLAVFASLYPSWAASRMAPMEAMRVE